MTVRAGWLLPAGQTREDTRLVPLGTMAPESAMTSRDGVIAGGTALAATGAGAMQVQIGVGRALVQGTDAQGAYPVSVTAPETLTIGDGHAQYGRIDAVVLRVNDSLYDTSGQTVARVEIVRGAETATPTPPTLPRPPCGSGKSQSRPAHPPVRVGSPGRVLSPTAAATPRRTAGSSPAGGACRFPARTRVSTATTAAGWTGGTAARGSPSNPRSGGRRSPSPRATPTTATRRATSSTGGSSSPASPAYNCAAASRGRPRAHRPTPGTCSPRCSRRTAGPPP